LVYDQSVHIPAVASETFVHDQLSHRTVAQVDVHVRGGGQLATIELGESHYCFAFGYVYRHRHESRFGLQSLNCSLGLADPQATFALAWICLRLVLFDG
jgi:hypothetical protein